MTICCLINLTSSVTLNGDTHEKWSDKLIDYFVFRTFGCTTFSHLNEEKLEPRV